MTNSEDLQEDAAGALGDVEKFRRELLEFPALRQIESLLQESQIPDTEELKEYRNRVNQLLNRLERSLHNIPSSSSEETKKALAFSLSTLANELNAQVQWLRVLLRQIKDSFQDSASAIREYSAARMANLAFSASKTITRFLVPLLKRFLSRIWQIIANLLTPKEWKLQGKVGTSLLGLADVGIEITFGA